MKKSFKKFVLLTASIVVAFCPLVLPAAASKSAKPAMKTRMTIQVGSMKRLSVTNASQKVKWSIKNKALVSVKKTDDNSIVLTGKKAGFTTVSARVGNTTLECRVTIKKVDFRKQVPKVEVETGVKRKYGVKVRWSKIKGADGYEVYKETKDGGKKLIKKYEKAVTSYNDKNASVQKPGNYFVRAYKKQKGSKVLYSSFNKKTYVIE